MRKIIFFTLAFLAISGLLGCLAKSQTGKEKPFAEPQTEQEKAIAAITKAGGNIVADENDPDKPVVEVDLSGFRGPEALL
jgi:hypothetical protein